MYKVIKKYLRPETKFWGVEAYLRCIIINTQLMLHN